MENNSPIQNKFYWFYLIGFFIILALPLLNLSPWFSPPDWGKIIVFRIVLSILIFLFIYQLLFQRRTAGKTLNNTPKNAEQFGVVRRNILHSSATLPFWLLVALLGIYFLATLFSSDIRFSFLGSPYRSGGFLNFSFYIIFAVLVLLIVRRNDWQKIWDFSIFIGILVSAVAIFQYLGLFSKIVIPFSSRPPSTIGGPTFLAVYLLLLTFLTFFFTVTEKKYLKKFFYFSALLLFLFVILITGSRAAYFGLLVGSFYFLFFWSINFFSSKKKILFLALKILVGILLIISAYGIHYLNSQPQLPQFVQDNKILKQVADRLSISLFLDETRFYVWKISLEAVKDRPIFGYGPENFSIGFDKYYNPSGLDIDVDWGSWWDRAHNFIFDISATAGIPALIIYFSLFTILFFRLQKLKYTEDDENKQRKTRIAAHSIQATFIGYLAANFFSFDVFSTYLISFLLIGYSLYLISSSTAGNITHETTRNRTRKYTNSSWKFVFLFVSISVLLWFIWAFNLKPFQINKEINLALYLSEYKNYNPALLRIEKILPTHTILDAYLRENYVEIIGKYVKERPEMAQNLSPKAIKVLKENIKIRPYYTRNWLLLGDYTNILIEKETRPEFIEKLKKETDAYYKKASELSPFHQEIFIGWAKTGLITGEYQKAKERIQQCIDLAPELGDCRWLKGLSNIYLGETEEAQENIRIADQKNFPVDSKFSLSQLVNAYAKTENYQALIETYHKLIELEPTIPQYHASLSLAYKIIGDYKKAREEAMIVLELSPESKANVEEFLRSLE